MLVLYILIAKMLWTLFLIRKIHFRPYEAGQYIETKGLGSPLGYQQALRKVSGQNGGVDTILDIGLFKENPVMFLEFIAHPKSSNPKISIFMFMKD